MNHSVWIYRLIKAAAASVQWLLETFRFRPTLFWSRLSVATFTSNFKLAHYVLCQHVPCLQRWVDSAFWMRLLPMAYLGVLQWSAVPHLLAQLAASRHRPQVCVVHGRHPFCAGCRTPASLTADDAGNTADRLYVLWKESLWKSPLSTSAPGSFWLKKKKIKKQLSGETGQTRGFLALH